MRLTPARRNKRQQVRHHDVAQPCPSRPRPFLLFVTVIIVFPDSRLPVNVAEIVISERADQPVAGKLIIAADLRGAEPAFPSGTRSSVDNSTIGGARR